MFSRGTKTSSLTSTPRADHAAAADANNGDKTSLPSRFASSFHLSKLSSRTATSASHPAWLKDGSSAKQLPGIYQGVLGQVQLQPALVSDSNKFTHGLDKLVSNQRRQQQADYMDRFTDTERVHQLLSTSRLSNEVLATIWAHVNKTFPGQLTNREVCIALALIAIFQRLANGDDKSPTTPERVANVSSYTKDYDPFSMIKLEKKPPVPKLYSNENTTIVRQTSPTKTRIPTSNSMPNELGSNGLLIDITSDVNDEPKPPANHRATEFLYTCNNNAISLIDMDSSRGDECEQNFTRQTQVWFQFMTAMKNLFKRSFDILNVENCRSSALEALSTPKGASFCKQLSVCYPIAHNIAFKVNELKFVTVEDIGSSKPRHLLDANYAKQINDLMVSINEYWAVLINLFHESGLKDFIELIMDGLNRQISQEDTAASTEWEQFKQDGRADVCSICLTKFYLVNIGDALEVSANWLEDDIELVFDTKLITQDNCFYYHPKCANFWLNHVPHSQGKLPFQSRHELEIDDDDDYNSTILKPTTNSN